MAIRTRRRRRRRAARHAARGSRRAASLSGEDRTPCAAIVADLQIGLDDAALNAVYRHQAATR
jgi:hypothetical protein